MSPARAAKAAFTAWARPPLRIATGAPVTATNTVASTLNASRPRVASIQAAPARLPTSRFARSDEARSAAPDRPTPRWARPPRPRSSRRASTPTDSTVRLVMGSHRGTPPPRRVAAPLAGPRLVPQHSVGVAEQLPTARRHARIDRRELARDRHGPGRHPNTRLVAPRAPAAAGRRRPDRRSRARTRRTPPATVFRYERPRSRRGSARSAWHVVRSSPSYRYLDHVALALVTSRSARLSSAEPAHGVRARHFRIEGDQHGDSPGTTSDTPGTWPPGRRRPSGAPGGCRRGRAAMPRRRTAKDGTAAEVVTASGRAGPPPPRAQRRVFARC